MGRIFWKILLGFWLTAILSASVIALGVVQFRDQLDGQRHQLAGELGKLRDQIVELLVREGGDATRERLAGEQLRDNIHVIRRGAGELLGRTTRHPSPPSGELAGAPPRHHRPGPPWIIGADGESYRIIVRPPRLTLFRIATALPLLLPLSLLVSVLVSILLARHLTRPIGRIQGAARAIAAGDLTARCGEQERRIGDELDQLGNDFDHMAQRLQDMVESQRQLLRDISHEVRSPLARAQVASALALRAAPDAGREIGRIELELVRIDELIGQLIDLSRLQSGDQAPLTDQLELDQLLESLAEDARFEASERQQQIELDLADKISVSGNGRLLHSAIENVVRNALRHSADGESVAIRLARMTGWATITISDRGPGVPPELLERIFEPFVRLDEARLHHCGSGIGLAIAASAIRHHGGTIQASNRPDGGLCVTIKLPTDLVAGDRKSNGPAG
jgi:signal transduction histidine kinase